MRLIKTFSILAVVTLLGASCNLFGSSGTPSQVDTKRTGMLRSANGGTDWQVANTIKDRTDVSLAGTNVTNIKFKPGSNDILYISSSNNGMFMSEDGGNTWTQILKDFNAYDFTFDPNNVDVLYVTGISANHGRVLVTKDSGKSWQEIYNEATTKNEVSAIYAETSQRLYIGLGDGNLVKSEDSGLSWKLVTNFKTFVSSIKSYNNTLYLLAYNKGLYKSADGQNFTNITGGLDSERKQSIFSKVGHFNQYILGNNSIYAATTNGLFRSLDQGATWTQLVLPVQNQSASILAVAVSPTNDNIVYTAIKSTIYKSSDGGNTWQTQNPNTSVTISTILIHPQNPQVVYAGATK